MDKRILKQIAKEWAKGILLATDMDSFDKELNTDEQSYVLDEVHKIARKITEEDASGSLPQIIRKYYDFE
jgi:hypothetical protein